MTSFLVHKIGTDISKHDGHKKMIDRHYKETHLDLVLEAIDDFEDLLPIGIKTIKEKNNGRVLGSLIQHSLDAFCDAVLADQNKIDILRPLTLVKEFGSANFSYAMNINKTFSVSINKINGVDQWGRSMGSRSMGSRSMGSE